MNFKLTQEAFIVLERLGALCNTPGVDDLTKQEANERIREILKGVMKSTVSDINSGAMGIVTMSNMP